MDSISELIAAGEALLEERFKANETDHNIPVPKSVLSIKLPVYEDQSTDYTKNSECDMDIGLNHIQQEDNSVSSISEDYTLCKVENRPIYEKNNVNLSKCSDLWSEKANCSSNLGLFDKPTSKTHHEDCQEIVFASAKSSNRTSSSTSLESFSQLHIQKLKEECALIFSLSHSMASSLLNANRLLSQLIKGDSGRCSSREESLLGEISACDDSCKQNEAELEAAGTKIYHLLGLVSDSYYTSKEQEATLSHVTDLVLELLELTKELLRKNNLKHLVADVNASGQRFSAIRLMDEVNLGLTLLSGELPSQHLQQMTTELEKSRKYQSRLEAKLVSLEVEIKECNDRKNTKISQTEIQLAKITKELEEAKDEIFEAQNQRLNLEKCFQDQLRDAESGKSQLVQDVVKAKQQLQAANEVARKDKEEGDISKSKLEQEISSLKAKLRSIDELRTEQEKTAEKVYKNLEGNQTRMSNEYENFKTKLAKAELDKQTFVDQIKLLEEDMEKQKILNSYLKEDILSIQEKARKKTEEYTSDLQVMEKRLDSKNEELCEKNSELRSLDVQVMELNTELDLERQRTLTLGGEIDILTKQVDRLQDKIKKLIQVCPRDVRLACGLNQTSEDQETQVGKLLEESQKRECDLKKLLEEKDEELIKLQNSLKSKVIQKSEEFEVLSTSVENLEDEMSQIVSSLNMSSDMFAASHRTSSYLDARSKHIQTLQDRVSKLSIAPRDCNSCESNSFAVEELKSELIEAKKGVRSAREEARKERLEAAKLRQQIAMMQIDLESAKEIAKYRQKEHSPSPKTHAPSPLRSSANSYQDFSLCLEALDLTNKNTN